MKNAKQKRAEELMKRLFEKQGIGEINLAVKETEVVKTEEEVEVDGAAGADNSKDSDGSYKAARQADRNSHTHTQTHV